MEITPQLFDELAHLARLQFADNEKDAIRLDMQKMIQFVEKLNEIDTTNVAPLVHITSAIQQPRADIANNGNTTAEVLLNAPASKNNYILVPKVIDNTN